MKNRLKRLVRSFGFVVVTSGHTGARYIDDPPRGVLDETLLRVFPSLHGLSFVQIGANDGVNCDPIRRHVLHYGWTGLLVEPLPAMFQQLQSNYREAPGLSFLRAAVDTRTGSRRIYQIRSDIKGLPAWTPGIASFNQDHLRAALRDFPLPPDAIVAEDVPTVTWLDVRAKFGERACDVLVIDVEGYDVVLLRLANLATWRPRVIQFEHASVSPAERLEFYGELLKIGYEIATAGADTVAWLPCP